MGGCCNHCDVLWPLTFGQQQRSFEMTLRLRRPEYLRSVGAAQLSGAVVVKAWPAQAQGRHKVRSRERGDGGGGGGGDLSCEHNQFDLVKVVLRFTVRRG